MRDLSVIIPARNEEFLVNTIDDILRNIEADTEIIVMLDGYWPEHPILDNPRIIIVHHTESIGQRASVNEGARISQAKYVMKADAHCAFDKGFDRKLMENCEYDWTVVPMMYHLHVFSNVCEACGHRSYQAPFPKECSECGGNKFHRDMVWRHRKRTRRISMRFDSDLIFQYWDARRPEGDLVETMSFIGASWFMYRDRFWELEGLDENHGGWGQVGTEVSCKTWLSGGKLVCNKMTWFAHMFRTQFGWPYHITQGDIDRARAYSRDLWFNNKWNKQIYPLKWLVDKFSPVPGWEGFQWKSSA